MKTALEYALDLERDLNLMDGLDDRAHKMPHTHDGEAYVTITGSMIIERHVKKIIEETAAEANRQSLESITNAARKLADASLRNLNAARYHDK
jgi:N-methylhydantoinase B/oxoprolinase/acetone carboxylase alpha subunit